MPYDRGVPYELPDDAYVDPVCPGPYGTVGPCAPVQGPGVDPGYCSPDGARLYFCDREGRLSCFDCSARGTFCGWMPGPEACPDEAGGPCLQDVGLYHCGYMGGDPNPDPSLRHEYCGGEGCDQEPCAPCVPDCTDRECGPDGAGGLCGICPEGMRCQPTPDGPVDYLLRTPADDPITYRSQCVPRRAGFYPRAAPGCGGCHCEGFVCEMRPECCAESWDEECVRLCQDRGLTARRDGGAGCGGCYCEDYVCLDHGHVECCEEA